MLQLVNNRVSNNSNERKTEVLTKIITLIICLFPLLSIYRAISIFMLSEFVAIIALFLILIGKKKIKISCESQQRAIFLFLFYVLLISSIDYLVSGVVELKIFIRLLRLIFYFILAIIFTSTSFDMNFAKKCIVVVSILATVLILYQYIYNEITGNYLYFILKDKIYSSEVYNDEYYDLAEQFYFFRPSSIFLEPSHFCQYVLFGVVILLFGYKFQLKNIIIALFLSCGVMISTSFTGILLCAMVWLIFIFIFLFKYPNNGKKIFLILSIFLLAIFAWVIFDEQVYLALERMQPENGSQTSVAFDSRLSSYKIFINETNIYYYFLGKGLGCVDTSMWYASIPYYFSGLGIIGILFVIALFVYLYIKSDNLFQKVLIILFAGLCISTEVLQNFWVVMIIPLILNYKKEEIKK